MRDVIRKFPRLGESAEPDLDGFLMRRVAPVDVAALVQYLDGRIRHVEQEGQDLTTVSWATDLTGRRGND